MVSANLVEYYTILADEYDYRITYPFDHALFSEDQLATTSLVFNAVFGSKGKTVNFTMIVQNGALISAGTRWIFQS